MRKNTARHWLHAALDLLPVILIPVFMIYSHRHDISGSSLEVPVNKVVDFNQIIPNRTLSSTSNFTVEFDSETYVLDISGNFSGEYSYPLASYDDLPIDLNTKFYIKAPSYVYTDSASDKKFYYRFYSHDYVSGTYFYDIFLTQGVNKVVNIPNFKSLYAINMIKWNSYSDFYYEIPLQIFNLTQMFGAGNEPTVTEFEAIFTESHYDYTLSTEKFVQVSTITYDDTDIMSQFTYQMYNVVDKYFNMGNVFGMNNVYDWFNLHIFGGNASISIYIVWNIVLYEFVMDLLFLLYALFMWFIDMIKRLIEKPMDSIK